MTITFHSEARKEFFEAADYYEEQVVGLGDSFVDEVEKVLEVIIEGFAKPGFLAEIKARGILKPQRIKHT